MTIDQSELGVNVEAGVSAAEDNQAQSGQDPTNTSSDDLASGADSVSKILAVVNDITASSEKLVDRTRNASQSRDVAVSTIIRLLGIPSLNEFTLLEKKIDALTAKISSVQQRVERLAAAIQTGNDFERIDVQLSDIHSLLKEILPRVIAPKSNKAQE